MPVSVVMGGDEAGDVQKDISSEEMEVEAIPPPPLFSGRTMEELETIMCNAKLDKSDLQSMSQEILFDTSFSKKEYRLVQLDKDILQRVEVGQILVFRGDENDAAVLCTDNETYEIKEAETSNSLMIFQDLLMPEIKTPAGSANSSFSKSPAGSANNSLNFSGLNDSAGQDGQNQNEDGGRTVKPSMIIEVAHSYLEMKKMRPNLSKIRFILGRSLYNDEPKESDNSDDDVTLESLLQIVAASEQEIVDYLEDIRVVDIKGKLRLVDDDYLFRIFSQLLNCVDENSWSSTEIDKEVVTQSLSSLAEPFFIEKIFKWFLQPYTDGGASTSRTKYTYQENKVCRFLGEVLLKTMGKFNLNEFLKIWQESVPEGLKTNLKQLNGMALYDEESSPPVISHFPEYNLPETLTERLSKLFEKKKKWKLDEISSYLEVFSTAAQSVGVLLTKYARSSTVNGVKYYSSKHGTGK